MNKGQKFSKTKNNIRYNHTSKYFVFSFINCLKYLFISGVIYSINKKTEENIQIERTYC